MRRNSILVLMIISIVLLVLGAGCAALSERQKLAGSALMFSAAVKQVESSKASGKMSEAEVRIVVAALKEAEKGIDTWRAALNMYELKIDAAMKATIKDSITRVMIMILEARAKP